MGVLQAIEKQELLRHEAVIERGIKTFIEVGTALMAIHDGALYRESHNTFEDYCRERWGMSRIHAHRMIESAQVVNNLVDNLLPTGNIPGPLPENERQVRPLARLDPPQQAEAWSLAVESAPNGKPTAKLVEAAARQVEARTNGHKTQPLPGQPPLFDDEDDQEEQAEVEASDPEPEDLGDETPVYEDETQEAPEETSAPNTEELRAKPGSQAPPIQVRPTGVAARPLPSSSENRLDQAIEEILVLMASVEDVNPDTDGWGGFDAAYRRMPAGLDVRNMLLHFAEQINRWIKRIDQIDKGEKRRRR